MSKRASKITEEDFSAWKDNPITQMVLEYLKTRKDLAHRIWAGHLNDLTATKDQSEQLRIELRAKLEFIDDFINLSLEDIEEDNDVGGTIVQIEPAKRAGKSNSTH